MCFRCSNLRAILLQQEQAVCKKVSASSPAKFSCVLPLRPCLHTRKSVHPQTCKEREDHRLLPIHSLELLCFLI